MKSLRPLYLIAGASLFAACFAFNRNTDYLRQESPQLDNNRQQTEVLEEEIMGDTSTSTIDEDFLLSLSQSEAEEEMMEDHTALEELIMSKLLSENNQSDALEYHDKKRTVLPSVIPKAADNTRLSGEQCFKALAKHKVSYRKPNFETPLVENPLLLTGPIYGVRIVPANPKQKEIHAVTDCHLALALVETARHAASLEISEIQFFSIYRGLQKPPATCPKGAAGKKCRIEKERFEKISSAQTSRHRFATAIDINLLKTKTGETLSVLEHFERKSGTDPCSYIPSSKQAQILTDFVCGLYENKIFNVMLTPNADKAHHNHFHFDLNPKASWYIIR